MADASRAPLSIDAAPAQGAGTPAPAAPANDNSAIADSSAVQVSCDLPEQPGILPGEAELIARYLPALLMAANDNGEGE